jgi:hypothetical protein
MAVSSWDLNRTGFFLMGTHPILGVGWGLAHRNWRGSM